MKKVFTTLVLLLACTAMSFADYYVVGDLTSWTYTPSTSITKMALLEGTTNTYYADYTPGAGDKNFCIAIGDGTDWGDFNGNYRYSSEAPGQNVSDGCYSVTLGENGERNLYINADGSTTYRIMLIEGDNDAKTLTVTKVGLEYVVAGSFTPDGGEEEANFFGTAWSPTKAENALTLQNDGTYVKTFTNVTLSKGTITYKITNSDWSSQTSTNQTIEIPTSGKYDITFTFYINNINGPVYTCEPAAMSTYTATFTNGAGWAHVYAYTWSGEKGSEVKQLGDWPGTEITKSAGIYSVSFEASVAPEYIIFNNGKNGAAKEQTADLAFVNNETYSYTISLPGTEIWSSETPVAAAWYSAEYGLIIDKSKFASAKVGDIIHVAVVDLDEGLTEWDAQVKLKDGYWQDVEKVVTVGNYDVKDAQFVITGDMLRLFKERGMIVSGQNYKSNKVTIESTEITGTANSIWVGNNSGAVTVGPEHFKTANEWVYVGPESWDYAFEGVKAGDVIKVSVTEINPEGAAWAIMQYSGADTEWAWTDYENPGCTYVESDGAFYYMVKAAHVDQMKIDGMIFNHGNKWAVTQVELLKQSGYSIVLDKGAGWIAGDEMTDNGEGVYSAKASGANYFAWIQNNALDAAGTGIALWEGVLRPTVGGDNNFWVYFQNYSDNVGSSDKVWEVKSDIDDVNITFTPSTGAYTLSCEKEIAIGATGYATYSNDYKYTVEGATANFVTVDGKYATLEPLAADAVLPAKTGAGKGAGIILSGEANSTATIKSVASDASAADASENLLAGSGDATYNISDQFSEGDKYTGYIFANHDNVLGFYKVGENKELAAHKAFLAVPTGATAPSFIGFDSNSSDVNGIESIETAKEGVKNAFNLAGQRVATPTKGLYIVNGKKVVLK